MKRSANHISICYRTYTICFVKTVICNFGWKIGLGIILFAILDKSPRSLIYLLKKGEIILIAGAFPYGSGFPFQSFFRHALGKETNFTLLRVRALPWVLFIGCHASKTKLKLFTALRAKVLTHKKRISTSIPNTNSLRVLGVLH